MKQHVGKTGGLKLTPTPVMLQRKCACGQHTFAGAKCDQCRDEEQQQQYGTLQRAAIRQTAQPKVPPLVHDVLRSSGQPLDASTRTFFESRFGYNFSQVRVHTGGRAAESARAVNAVAYTVGHHVVLGEGHSPSSHEGRRLMAHELAHVVQQTSGRMSSSSNELEIGDVDSVHEREADHAAERALSGLHTAVHSKTPGMTVQRAVPVAIGALAGKCIVGAIIGAVFDLAIQAGMHMWDRGEWSLEGMRVDYCSTILSAILGCIGGVVAARWLEPWINSALGPRLAGISGTLIGRVLLFITNKLAVGIPRTVVKKLADWHCISDEQAEALVPGISRELVASAGTATTRGASGGRTA